MARSNMSDVTIHKNMLLRIVCVEENCRLRQKYSICLLEEVAMLGCFADKARVCRMMFCESVPFLIALQHGYGYLQSTYVWLSLCLGFIEIYHIVYFVKIVLKS